MIDSKEALVQIKNHLYAILKEEAPELIHHYDNKFAIVEKDLEVLEILKSKKVPIDIVKNCIDYNRGYKFYNIGWLQDRALTEEEYRKIKEWMER